MLLISSIVIGHLKNVMNGRVCKSVQCSKSLRKHWTRLHRRRIFHYLTLSVINLDRAISTRFSLLFLTRMTLYNKLVFKSVGFVFLFSNAIQLFRPINAIPLCPSGRFKRVSARSVLWKETKTNPVRSIQSHNSAGVFVYITCNRLSVQSDGTFVHLIAAAVYYYLFIS